jgi:PilZ domain
METVIANCGQIARRRSTRMAVNMSIAVSGQDRPKSSFTMTANATNLNKHGAAIQLNRELLVGSTISVQNQRGSKISARVVSQLPALQGICTYGIEFLEQDDTANSFWGITFPSVEKRPPMARAAEQAGIARRRRGIASLQSLIR